MSISIDFCCKNKPNSGSSQQKRYKIADQENGNSYIEQNWDRLFKNDTADSDFTMHFMPPTYKG